MFAGLINQAKSAASGLILKYVARASVAVPFVIAIGFSIAALRHMLVERFGHVTAYWLMAGGMAAIGSVAAISVSVKEHTDEAAETKAEASDTQEAVSDAAMQAMVQTPIALLGGLFALPGGPSMALRVSGILARNYPLVLLMVVIGTLFWPTTTDEESAPTDDNVSAGTAETYH